MGKKTKQLLEKLEKGIEQVKSSEEFKEVLEFFSQFHNYSINNQILIKQQQPDATHVAGYKKWQKLGRQVQKGEKDIKILAPFTYKKKITEIVEEEHEDGEVIETEKEVAKTFTSFRPVTVFDISQTEGDPVPTLNISLEDDFSEILEPLVQFAAVNNIDLDFKEIDEDPVLSQNCHGYSAGDYIAISTTDRNQTEQATTLVHELAHEELHKTENEKYTKEIKEMEAEAVAFVVMNHYNVELESNKYLALYKQSYDLKESLERISQTSKKIIEFVNLWFEDQEQVKRSA